MFGFLGWNSDRLYTWPWQAVECSPPQTYLTVKLPCFEQESGLETSRGSSQPTGVLWLCVGYWRVQLIHSWFRKSSGPFNFSYRNFLWGFVCLGFFFIIIIIISMSNLNCVLIRHFFQYEIHDVTDFVFLQESWGKKMKHTFKKCQATPSLMLPVYHYYCPALALSAT